LDIGDNSIISYSILPPYDTSFIINDQGQVFNSEILNQSSYYNIRIMAIDHGKPNRLNSTQDCSISTSRINIFDNFIEKDNISFSNITFITNKNLFQWSLSIFDHYSYVIIGLFLLLLFIIIITITISITFCLHTFIFGHKNILKTKKTYNCSRQFNFYDTVQRKSLFIHDESGCSSSKLDDHDDITSEERERLVNLNGSDRTSCESSDSMHKQIRIINKVNYFIWNISNQFSFSFLRSPSCDHCQIIKIFPE